MWHLVEPPTPESHVLFELEWPLTKSRWWWCNVADTSKVPFEWIRKILSMLQNLMKNIICYLLLMLNHSQILRGWKNNKFPFILKKKTRQAYNLKIEWLPRCLMWLKCANLTLSCLLKRRSWVWLQCSLMLCLSFANFFVVMIWTWTNPKTK